MKQNRIKVAIFTKTAALCLGVVATTHYCRGELTWDNARGGSAELRVDSLLIF